MDAFTFTKTIDLCLDRRLGEYKLEIVGDNLPTSVRFLVTSEDFRGLSRAKRIRFLADVVKEAFGLPLTFGPMGLAIAPGEDYLASQDRTEDDDLPLDSSNSSAARSEDLSLRPRLLGG